MSTADGFVTQTGDGRFIGPFHPALQSPIVCGSFLHPQAVEEESSSLSPRVRQVMILTVGAVWQSAYEQYAHSAAARSAGLPDQAVRALAATPSRSRHRKSARIADPRLRRRPPAPKGSLE